MGRKPWRNAQNRDRPEMAMAQTGFYDTKRGWADRPRTGGGGGDTIIVIARATTDVLASDASFTAKIKATISGTPQTFDTEITVENLQPGDYLAGTVTGNYRPSSIPAAPNNDHVFVLLQGHNFIAVKANTDNVSWPSAHALKTGWFILQAPGTYVDCPADPPPDPI